MEKFESVFKEHLFRTEKNFIDIFISFFTDFLSQQSQQEHLFFHYIVAIHLKATEREDSDHFIA